MSNKTPKPPKPNQKTEQGSQMDRFNKALKKIVSVPKTTIKKKK